ncbi:MAG TPA: hypothetical protein VMF65_18725 [Acidimicrobiales bacterium]|nr:hypothetical protein [Acidimicrobiales bacterium]
MTAGLRFRALLAGGATVALGLAAAPVASASASPVATVSALSAFPSAGQTYPNGAIVQFGSSYYVFAGGRAFLVPSYEMRTLRLIDPAVVVSAASSATAPTDVALRPGTLVTSNGVTHDSTIYVAGPSGELYGFASPRQFLGGGFDPALVVTVPGLGNLPVSASTAGASRITALSTQADGAIVFSGQTYVFAAGAAFVLSAPGDLAQLRTTDEAAVLTGTVGQTETPAPLASGVLLSVAGQGVYVTYQGQLFPFSSMAQLAAEGYGGTAAVPVPASVVASIPQA